jgi:FkbM family methyltransferase
MAFRYYSPSGEDALAWSVFRNEPPGFFVEVGAFDGRHLSNTLSFEEQGWTGICVEAHPDFIDFCRANRRTCVHAACVAPGHAGKATFLSEPLGVLSGIRADLTQNLDGRYASRGMAFAGFTPVEVPARTLDEIIAEHKLPRVDFLSIDVEGTEIDVLAGFSMEARVIVAEANTEAECGRLQRYMTGRGYTLARTLVQNLFFARRPEDISILSAATFDILTEATLHPLGEKATHPRHAGMRHILGASGLRTV